MVLPRAARTFRFLDFLNGYTLLAVQASFAINPSLQKLNYDIATDFSPVALVGIIPLVMVAPNQLPATSASEVFAMAKAQPGKLSYASYGAGSAGHIASPRNSSCRWPRPTWSTCRTRGPAQRSST